MPNIESARKIWIYSALIILIAAIGICVYLTRHHYTLLYGMRDEKSFCSLNSTFDCDSVNVSSFSEIAGVPVALLGGFTFSIELLFLLGALLLGEEEKAKPTRVFFYLAWLNMIFCLYLGAVSSFYLKTFCLYCITTYLLSGLLLLCAYKIKSKGKTGLKTIFGDLKSWSVVVLIAIIPLGSLFVQASIKDGISQDLDTIVDRAIGEWSQGKKYDFMIKDAPTVGTSTPKLQIVIFSDFQCPHCKHAAPSLHAFANAHKDKVQLVYQNYPLDSSCNPKGGMHKQACELARASICAYKMGRFQDVHDWIFENQDTLSDSPLNDLIAANKLDSAKMNECMKDPETDKFLSDQIARANMADIHGTPSIFANGQLLPNGAVIPILEKALKAATAN